MTLPIFIACPPLFIYPHITLGPGILFMTLQVDEVFAVLFSRLPIPNLLHHPGARLRIGPFSRCATLRPVLHRAAAGTTFRWHPSRAYFDRMEELLGHKPASTGNGAAQRKFGNHLLSASRWRLVAEMNAYFSIIGGLARWS
jgi:hypothetical protein